MRLKQFFPFHLIDAMGSLSDTQEQIIKVGCKQQCRTRCVAFCILLCSPAPVLLAGAPSTCPFCLSD
jgi:hypothetical protein